MAFEMAAKLVSSKAVMWGLKKDNLLVEEKVIQRGYQKEYSKDKKTAAKMVAK